jgi:hypothetical protein
MLEPFLHLKPEEAPCHGDKNPPITDLQSNTTNTIKS